MVTLTFLKYLFIFIVRFLFELGCEIALQVCEAGYYCNAGEMLPCPPVSHQLSIVDYRNEEYFKLKGKYREAVTDVSILALDKVCFN
jgi:hypothetical protein